jgi:aminomethyltransferase
LRYFHFVESPLIVGRIGYSGELGYEILVRDAEAAGFRRRLLEAGRGERLRECTWAAADSLRIESGYVLFDREIDGRANPRELGLERLVDDRTKDFQLRQKLVGLELLEGSPPENLPAAYVTSECRSPTLGRRLALGFVGPSVAEGSAVRIDGARTARVAALPFYDPERCRPRADPI